MILSFCLNKSDFYTYFLKTFLGLSILTITGLMVPAEASPQTQGILLSDHKGKILLSENPSGPMIPASTIKLLTSLAAIKELGLTHRFKTWVAFDTDSKDLYIKGFGDPLLVSEILSKISKEIVYRFNPTFIRNIIIDTSFFSRDISIPGTGNSKNPYDATTGALCANFNTINFKWDSRTQTYISGEPQTPLLDIFQASLKSTGAKKGRILLSKDQRIKYPGQLIQYFLAQQGVEIRGEVVPGRFPIEKERLEFESEFTIEQVIEKLLEFSNNFIANQLLLVMGARAYGPPATLEKGLSVIKEYAANELGFRDFKLVEGSGLSRQNRITPEQMLAVVNAFKPYYHLLKQGNGEVYKTGTLSDVRTRAGFFLGPDNELYPFVIMLNNTTKGYGKIQKKLKQLVFKKGKN